MIEHGGAGKNRGEERSEREKERGDKLGIAVQCSAVKGE
jgi:hypothetical protein